MKILFITTVPSPYRVDFFNELGSKCNLTVLFERRNEIYRHSDWMGTNYEKFKAYFIKKLTININNKKVLITQYIKKEKFDFVIIGVYSSKVQMLIQDYLILKKIPYIISSDGGLIKEDNFLKKMIKVHYIKNAEAWLSTGRETSNYLKYYGANTENIHLYPFTSIKNLDIIEKSLSYEEKKLLKKKLNINEEKVIVSVGRFIYGKGFDLLIKACENLNDDIAVIIIGGQITEEYKSLINKCRFKNFYFLDHMNKDELKNYYKLSDLFVLPTRYDVWGLVINEAMACGLPIITTNKCNAGLTLIKNKINGYIVESEDHKQLKNRIFEILNNNELRQNMAKQNINDIKNYTIEKMADRHIEIFTNLNKTNKLL